jgi:hypothetical protein
MKQGVRAIQGSLGDMMREAHAARLRLGIERALHSAEGGLNEGLTPTQVRQRC